MKDKIVTTLQDIWRSIEAAIVPIHKAGYPFILGFAAAVIVLGAFSNTLGWIAIIALFWCIWFFRDPERVTIQDEDVVVSPADGRVCLIDDAVPPAELGLSDTPMTRICVFMNVFNCHVNRVPVAGTVNKIAYKEGAFFNAELDKASEHNERNGLIIDSKQGQFGVVQIAGLIARRILCFVEEDADMKAGERFGLIRFGSRVDVYMPANMQPMVAVGQSCIAGETILASVLDKKAEFLTT